MTNGTQPEDEDDAPAVQRGNCFEEAVLIVVFSVLAFLGSVAYIVATAKGPL